MSKEINVLIIGFQEEDVESITELLDNEVYGVEGTISTGEAIEILARENIKVVVADNKLAGMTGMDILRRVQELSPKTERIVLCSSDYISSFEKAVDVGDLYRFIIKPWEPHDLRTTIRHAIDLCKLKTENQNLFKSTKTKIEALEIANRKIRAMYEVQMDFSSTVSHELRTPLAAIKMAIDIVMSGTAGKLTEQQKDFLTKAKVNIDRLKRLINEILDLSKLESGNVEFSIQLANINTVISEIIDSQEAVAKSKGLYLEADLNMSLPRIAFDGDKISQVLTNLISNAIKFTEKGGITIRSINSEDANYLEVVVEDTGIGIDQDDVPKLFHKYQQLGDPAKRKTGGTGLGLSICSAIVKKHGGKIWMDSQCGRGTRVHFNLPIHERRVHERRNSPS